MTREEAIKIFNTVLFFGKCDCPKEDIEECLKMAIKALEQEHILDKLRERVELEKLGYPPSAGYYKAIMKVLQIIDKYKAEMGVEE